MKGLLLKVGVGVVLGVGSMLLAAPAAKAAPPCDPQSPPQGSVPCANASLSCVLDSEKWTLGNCYDSDGDCHVDSSYDVKKETYKCVVDVGGTPTLVTCIDTSYPDGGPCSEA